MSKHAWRARLAYIARESGLNPAPGLLQDWHFWLALVAGIVTVSVLRERLPVLPADVAFGWLLVSLVLWQPLVEELLFRGILQGQLVNTRWGARSYQGISVANIASSVAFAAIHMVNNPALLSLSVLVPSLLYGYFRDRFTSCIPAIVLHCAYNGMVFAACLLMAK